MRNKLLAFGAALVVAATFGVIQLSAHASNIDNGSHCDTVSIVKCGTHSTAQILNAWDNYGNNVRNTYQAFGITRSQINGLVEGVVYKDGRVTVGGKTVATNAMTAGRNWGGSNRTHVVGNIYKYSTSQFVEDGQTALVKMVNGQFKWAIAKPCGNPVSAKPVPPAPKPPAPKPKPVAACTNVTVAKIDDHNFRFSATGSTAHGATIKSFTFRVYQGGSVIRTKSANASSNKASVTYNRDTPGSYKVIATAATSLGNKSSNACEASFSVPKPPAPKPTPVYACDETTAKKISRTQVQFTTTHTAKNATFKSVEYVIRDSSGKQIARQSSSTYTQTKTGTYSVQAYVTFLVNGKTQTVSSTKCKANFTVPAPKTPAISIQKLVDHQKEIQTQVGQQFTYELQITNSGEVDLKNSVVTDTPPTGVTLLKGSVGTITSNKWTYVIPELKVGQSIGVTITAKVPEFVSGELVNTACVDSPQVPGSPDDCDHATVSVPPCEMPGKENLPANSPECQETPPATVVTPPELPHTGSDTDNTIVALIGAGSLIGALGYYIASRRALG